MNARIKDIWIDDLLTNQGKQGIGRLRSKDDKYCCIGRLCNLYAQETGKGEWTWSDELGWHFEVWDSVLNSTMRDALVAPREVLKWAEVTSAHRGIETDGLILSELNDSGRTFKEIAEVIRTEL